MGYAQEVLGVRLPRSSTRVPVEKPLMVTCGSCGPVGGRPTFPGAPQGHHFKLQVHTFADWCAIAADHELAYAGNADVQRSRTCTRHDDAHIVSSVDTVSVARVPC